MKPRKITNSVFNSTTYVIEMDGRHWLVDCGDVEPIRKIAANDKIEGVLLTHGHFDHIYGLNEALRQWPDMKVFCSGHCREQLFNPKLNYSKFMLASEDIAVLEANCGKPFTLDEQFAGNIRIVDDGDFIRLDDGKDESFTEPMVGVVATPGHDMGCLSYIIGKYFFTGDSYIPGVKTVTNLRGDKSKAAESEKMICEIAEKSGLTICPGHIIE